MRSHSLRTDRASGLTRSSSGYTNLNQQDKVIEDCTNALRLDNSYIKALNRRGTAREQIGGIDSLYLALCGSSRGLKLPRRAMY